MSCTNVGVGPQGGNPGAYQGTPTSGTPTGVVTHPLLPFMVGLSLLDFSHLINDSLLHNPTWLEMLTKLPLDIPKFEGNWREDPTNHVCSFHMWCSSNFIIKGSIHLLLFQRMLIGAIVKWYVDQPRATHSTLVTLSIAFLSYILLPLHYDTSTKLLNFFIKLLQLTFLTMFMNGIEGGGYVELLNSKTDSIWIGFLDHCWPPFQNISCHTFLSLMKSHSK